MKSNLLDILKSKSRHTTITYWTKDTLVGHNSLQALFDDTGDESTFYGFSSTSFTDIIYTDDVSD